MSYDDYAMSRELNRISGVTPRALIMAAMHKASGQLEHDLMEAFPDVFVELDARDRAPGGRLDIDVWEIEQDDTSSASRDDNPGWPPHHPV